MCQYLKVTRIEPHGVYCLNDNGNEVIFQRNLLQYVCYSADHFRTEVGCNMTELVEILRSAKDSIFTVKFNAQPTERKIEEALGKMKVADIKKDYKGVCSTVSKGQEVTLVCHLAHTEELMGRTLVVVPNSSKSENGFALIDHRTIQHIILRNVKYSLAKKSTLASLAKPDPDAPKFDLSKLAVGNKFSEMQYYKL